jgi:pimeloyl-ACP methyl ester carboxylesterase
MSKNATVLLHGWSDSSRSFAAMGRFLARHGVAPVESLLYADYESREDSITFSDIIDGLNDRFIERGIIDRRGRALREVNVVVHSTGGLVIRHWIWRYYRKHGDRIDECPVKKVVMLAPANFGSPLAHRGKSFLGSLLKGRRGFRDFLEVGRQILTGLELASPYQWILAEGDILTEDPYWLPERIQLTVLTGADEYPGLRGLVSKDGTDGTVVIAGTPLNTVKLTLDPRPDGEGPDSERAYRWSNMNNRLDAAFGVIVNTDHGSIVDAFAGRNAETAPVCRFVLQALRARSAAEFRDLQAELRQATAAVYAQENGRKEYQQFLVRAVDDQGTLIEDYTLEFSVWKASKIAAGGHARRVPRSRAEEELSEEAGRLIGREFHRHSESPAYRRFLVEPRAVGAFLERARNRLGEDAVLCMGMHVPPVDRGIRYEVDDLHTVALFPADASQRGRGSAPTFLFPNTTTLLEVVVDRVNDYVFLESRPRG